MATARELVIGALTQIGAYAAGETPSAADAQLGLTTLQDQLDSWAADQLAIAVTTTTTFTLLANTSMVTIGTGGTVNAARPTWFTQVNYVIPASTPPVETPMGPMDDDAYANLSIKTLTSNLPTQYYYNATTPLGTLFFWPTPTQNVQIKLYYDLPVSQPAVLDDDVIGPPGYREAIKYALAVRLAEPFGRPVTPTLMEWARVSFATMTRQNNQPGLLGVDSALVPMGGGGAYNVRSDTYTGSSGR